jgi:hypothetical protein
VLPSERKAVTIYPKIFDGYVAAYQLAPDIFIASQEGRRTVHDTGYWPVAARDISGERERVFCQGSR